MSMCFRPAGLDQSADCPNCGKRVNAVLGVFPDECPFCGAKVETGNNSSASPAPPSAPGAPNPPKAPGAPKAPGTPKPSI